MPKPSGPKSIVDRSRTRQHDEDKVPLPTGDRTVDVTPPDDLTDDAVEVWHAVVPALAKMGAYTAGDLPMLVEFVSSLALARASRQAYEEGVAEETIETWDRNGGRHTIQFLGSQEAKRLRTDYTAFIKIADSLGAQFGLTPTARARLGLTVVRATSLRDAIRDALGDPEEAVT